MIEQHFRVPSEDIEGTLVISNGAAELNAGESKPGRSTIHAFEY